MSAAVALRDTPAVFLDPKKWAELRSFANNDLTALTYINAFYPDRGNLSAFFCGREGSFKEAIRCYQLGRALVQECRWLLLQRKLIATRPTPSGKRINIPADAWINLWPLFATGRVNGPGVMFEEIEIHETDEYKLEQDCVSWLISHPEVPSQKKVAVYYNVSSALGKNLSHAIFNAAYKRAFARKRGRPRKAMLH